MHVWLAMLLFFCSQISLLLWRRFITKFLTLLFRFEQINSRVVEIVLELAGLLRRRRINKLAVLVRTVSHDLQSRRLVGSLQRRRLEHWVTTWLLDFLFVFLFLLHLLNLRFMHSTALLYGGLWTKIHTIETYSRPAAMYILCLLDTVTIGSLSDKFACWQFPLKLV